MALPSTSDFLNAAEAAYSSDPGSTSPLSLLTNVNGRTITATKADGFHGIASVTDTGQVIVSFEGTDLGDLDSRPVFVGAQLQADAQIYAGEDLALYGDALRFTQRALAVAGRQGISSDDVFLAGHSLGGAEAEYVAAQTGLAGETFGAPGIPSADLDTGLTSRLVNDVDYGDPVGNYSANPRRLGNFLASDDIERYGDATYVGQRSDARVLVTAGQLFGTSDFGTATSLGLIGDAAVDHHPLANYAADLGVDLPNDQSSASISANDLAGIVSLIVGTNGGAGSLASLSAPGAALDAAAQITAHLGLTEGNLIGVDGLQDVAHAHPFSRQK